MIAKIGNRRWLRSFISGNICFEFLVQWQVFSIESIPLMRFCLVCRCQILGPWLCDIVDHLIGLSYRPASWACVAWRAGGRLYPPSQRLGIWLPDRVQRRPMGRMNLSRKLISFQRDYALPSCLLNKNVIQIIIWKIVKTDPKTT